MGGASLEDLPEPPQTILHAKEKFMSGLPGHLLQEDLKPDLNSYACSQAGFS